MKDKKDIKRLFIPGTDNAYDISEYGTVRTYYKREYNYVDRKHHYIVSDKPQGIRLPSITNSGVKSISLRVKGKHTNINIGICVYKLFIKDFKGRKIIGYKDNDANNNHYSNLYLIDWTDVTTPINRGMSVFNEKSVIEFRKEFNTFIKHNMKKYNISKHQLKNIISTKSRNI